MIKCPHCKELIGASSVSYKASRGFLDKDGVFHEDVSIIMHLECAEVDVAYGELESLVKNS